MRDAYGQEMPKRTPWAQLRKAARDNREQAKRQQAIADERRSEATYAEERAAEMIAFADECDASATILEGMEKVDA